MSTLDQNKYNRWLKRICMSHELTKIEIVEIMQCGGMNISNSTAEDWKVSQSHKNYRIMNEEQFDTFTNGLLIWTREQ